MVQALRTSLRYGGLRQGGLQPGLGNDDIFTTASLDLNFAVNKNLGTLVDATTGTNLIDFTRATSGTYVGSDGLIKTATTNLLLRSEEFNQSPWSKGANTTVTPNYAVAPNGTLSAYRVEMVAGVGTFLTQSTTLTNGLTYTLSVYARATIGTSQITLAQTGTNIQTFPLTTAWERISVTFTASSSTFVGFDNSDTAIDVLVWGAQLERSSTVGEYIKTTSAINSAPRFDHDPVTGESLGLLVEESRINRFQWSNSAVNGETWNNVGSSLNLQTGATGPAGGTDGIIASDANNLNTGTFLQRTGIDASLPANTVVTYSVWVKPISTPNDAVILNLFANGVTDSLAVTFTNTNGVLAFGSSATTGTGSVAGASAIPYPNGWYRLVITGIPSTTVGSDMRARINLGSYQQVQGTPRFYWYGAQLETGLAGSPAAPFVTSYIPTIGSAVTRAADVASISGSNFSSWYNASEGTVFAKAFNRRVYDGTNRFPYILQFDDGGNANRISLDHSVLSGGYRAQFVVRNGDINQADISAQVSIPTGDLSLSAAYALNSFAASSNRNAANTDPSGTIPTVNRLQIGTGFGQQYNGTIRRLCYWQTRLPNEVLQAITL